MQDTIFFVWKHVVYFCFIFLLKLAFIYFTLLTLLTLLTILTTPTILKMISSPYRIARSPAFVLFIFFCHVRSL